ncbi:FYVE and coiled-coil domain-containing protein 1-like isoform X1 [Dermacentor silvarum]|uniref:FYVE and coiled-coil domain-containing protein 1-like isoform X1 n=1 Tax=Dermacentor silvarum TaxID=543639 RepID=UPI001899447E|nr:FYVE and coiled-coil domain-containing protein 1-like isoform X1 [Dermacentor silvarum]
MASGVHVDQALAQIKQRIQELCEEFRANDEPVNDDSTTLNKFCSELEQILQHGQKDRGLVLNVSKGYWGYFCRCLVGEKNLKGYSALKYAKSLSELKTPLGRGRAVIRYCLVHQCLADTLQTCTVDENSTRDHYHAWALLRQPETQQSLLSSLYDLNAVPFDLAPSGNDLDTSWPLFARKVFGERWPTLSRCSSISSMSSVNSTHSQMDLTCSSLPEEGRNTVPRSPVLRASSLLSSPSVDEVTEDVSRRSELELQPTVRTLKSRSLSPIVFKISSPEACGEMSSRVQTAASSSQMEGCLPERLAEAEARAASLSERLEKMAEEWRVKEKAWLEKEAQIQSELESLRASQSGETACVQSTCKTCDDLNASVQRLSGEKDDLTTKNNFLARKLNEVLEKLEDSEESVKALKHSEADLRTRTEKLSFVNEGLKNLVDAVKDEATILRQQVIIMDKEIKSSHELLEQKKMQCKCLEDQLVKLRSKCCESINASAIKDREIERLANLVRVARRKLFSKSSPVQQGDSSPEESSKLPLENNMSDEALLKILSSEETEDSLIPTKQVTRTESSNCELFEHCLRYLGSAMLHHESLIDKANARVRDLVSTSHSINLQLHVMQEVLSMQHLKEDGAPDEKDISLSKEVAGPSEELVPPRIEGCDFVTSLFETMCRNHSKMQSLMQSESLLEKELADSRELNKLLSSKVHEQERKLCGFVQELDRTKTLLAGMEDTHHKLQTAKAVMRYELQEKKHLLHNLRQQLESTRESCVKVKSSNAESEIEWKSLREEFQSRKKQDSQDSGVSDNGQSTREQTPSSGEECSEREDPESVEDDDHSDSLNVDEIPEEGAAQCIPDTVADIECKYRARSQRLEYLEQQCQILYNSLVRSSERSNSLQRRLHSLLEAGGSSSEPPTQSAPADIASSIPVNSEDSESREVVAEEEEEECDVACDDVPDVSAICGDVCDDGALPEIRKRTLGTIVHRVKLERSQSEEVISKLRANIVRLEESNERLQQQVTSLAEEKAQRENEMRQRASGMLRTERSLKSVQIQEISRERGELLIRNKELEEQLEQKDLQLTRIDENRRQSAERQQLLEREVCSLTERLQDQAAANSHLYRNYVTQQTIIQEMRERLEDQERMIGELEHCVEDLKEDQVTEQTKFAQEIERLQLVMASREEECSILSDELKKLRVQADVDKEYGDQLKQQLDQSYAQVASFEDQLSQLKMDTVELKKKIVKLVKEKDMLWKQNDSLQFLQKLQATDKWMDNTETDSCLQCSAAFTFTLRKHHCRLCGRIYCHNCCSNWLMTTASSRPARVCNSCAFQHQQLERAARNPSVCSNASADSEDDDIGELAVRRKKEPSETDTVDSSNRSSSDEAVCCSAPIQGAPPRTEVLKMTRNWSFPRLRRPQFLQSSSSFTDSGSSSAKQEFDIISDEEIARSLLACSPYNSSPKTTQDRALFHMGAARTMDEIAQCGPAGLRGEVWVNAGGRYSIPVLLPVTDTALFWQFYCEPKSISFEMRYKPLDNDAELEMMDVILPSVRVQADVQPFEGNLVVKNVGVYVLVFDNQHSKFMAKKVSYKLHLHKPCASDSEMSNV